MSTRAKAIPVAKITTIRIPRKQNGKQGDSSNKKLKIVNASDAIDDGKSITDGIATVEVERTLLRKNQGKPATTNGSFPMIQETCAARTTGTTRKKNNSSSKTAAGKINNSAKLPPIVTPQKLLKSNETPTLAMISTTAGTKANGNEAEISCDLISFGIKPAPRKTKNPSCIYGIGDSKLKFCVIQGSVESAMVFCFEPLHPNNIKGPWAEKLLVDAVKANEKFVTDLRIEDDILYWFHNNEAQMSPINYGVRLFFVRTLQLPKDQSVVAFGKHLCKKLADLPRNWAKAFFDENDYFWLQQPVVWSDVIGTNAALRTLLSINKGLAYSGTYLYMDLQLSTLLLALMKIYLSIRIF